MICFQAADTGKASVDREIIKKERRDGRKCSKQLEEEKKQDLPEFDYKRRNTDGWIYGDEEEKSEKADSEKGNFLRCSLTFVFVYMQDSCALWNLGVL